MPHRDIVVIGASAGGIDALGDLLAHVPTDLPAAIFAVVHISPDGGSLLPKVLGRRIAWPVAYGVDGEAVVSGRVYIAPPDHHLLIKPARVRVVRGPRENRFRPAVDPMFRTAAESYGPRVIGVVLSGALDDGTHGLEIIKRHGGVALAQDPEEALVPSMPLSAIQNVEVDHILSAAAIAAQLKALMATDVEGSSTTGEGGVADVAEGTAINQFRLQGRPSDLTCPECGGALRELDGSTVLRFRCHVGHGYTADSLLADQGDGLENAFWGALRALEEHSMLRRRLAEFALESGRAEHARQFERDAKETELRASAIRRILHADGRGRNGRATKAAPAPRRKRAGQSKQTPGTRTRRANR
jgi:two-component system, chemotaxis family, protein-glutamate methylesterase/glutaminase